MAASTSTVARYCKGCEYPLAGVAANVCPECGRAFDPGDPGTYIVELRRRRWIRVIRRVSVAIVLVGLVVVVFPRGCASGTITFTCGCGERVMCWRGQLIAPSWCPVAYPHWTKIPGTKAAMDGHAHVWMFNLGATRRDLTWRGTTTPGGGLTAAGGATPDFVGTINDMPATPEGAAAVLADVVGTMARTHAFGVRAGNRAVKRKSELPESARPGGG